MTLRLAQLLFIFFVSENIFGQFIINGSALHSGDGNYLLTPAQGAKAGSIWYEEKISLEESFELNFELYFGTKDNGADGITFCLQPLGNNVGVPGGGLGVQGVQPSFFVEFDTYINGGDPSYDHLALQKNGNVQNNGTNNLFPATHIKAGQNNVENGQWYPMRAIWNATTKRFQLFVDCNLRIDYTGDIVQEIFGGDPMVFWGFTASTGGANNEHRVRNVRSTLLKIDDESICRGEGVQIQIPATNSSFSWSPTTGIDNLNSLTPTFTPAQTTEYIISYDGFCNTQLNDTILIVVDNCGCEDFDLDGVCDDIDLDDDNDGILDVNECMNSDFHWSAPPQINGNTAIGVINGIQYTYTSSINIETTSGIFAYNRFPLEFNIPNTTVIKNRFQSNNTITFNEPVLNPTLMFSSIGGGPSVPIKFSNPIEVLFQDGPVTIDSPNQITGKEGYVVLRMNGTFTEISFDYLADENYVNFTFGADFATFCDTDGDGKEDYLDGDSDGDGCFDALEGGGGFELGDLLGESLSGGVDENGVPILANGGHSVGSSSDETSVAEVCIPCNDTDQDGVCDDIDLDDDNDGILDDIECPTAQVSTTFETSNGATTTFNAPAADKGFQFNVYQLDNSFNLNVNGVDLVPGEIQCQGTGSTGESQLVFLSDNSGYGQAGNDNIWVIQGTKASPVIQLNIDKDGVVSFLGKRNTGAVLEPMRLRLGQPQPQNLTWNVNGANVVVLSQRVSGPTNISGEGFGIITCSEDTDGDGVLNYLDTDSDGDGCFDALEGGDSFEEADLSGEVLIGGVDANGVPIIANGGQDKGASANSNVVSSVCKEPLCGGDINFNLWNQSGLKSEGNWVVASDGKSVNQTINGAPTFFIGEKDYLNVNFSGKMRTDNGDDDWIGMVFGFQSLELKENYPITLKTYVFSWKQRNQGSWEEGFSLYEVNGTFNSRSELENAFRNPSSGSGFLASEFGNNLGYQTGQDYEISISYTSTKITVYVNGVLVLEKNGCFDPGKIGFFNDSQPNVTYSDFKYQFVGNIDISKDTLCLGDEVEVAVYDGPSCGSENYYPQGTLFEWDLRDGTLSNQNKFIYEYLDTGAYDIRLVVSDGIGCSDTTYSKLYVSDYPTKSLPIDTTVCLGDHFLLDARNDGSDYLWNIGQTTQSIEVTNSGEYSVEIVNWGKCITKDTTSIVFDSVPIVDLGDDVQICQGNSVSLDAHNSGLDFLWNTGDTNQKMEVFSSGIFGVEAINSNGCIGSDSVFVNINPLPIVRLGNDTVLCSGQIYLLNAENQGANYLWSSGESSQTISVSEVGGYVVVVTDDKGCSSSDTVEVSFNELPEVYLGEDTTICEYQSIILNAQNEGLYFSWNDGSELQSIEVSDDGLYAVEVRDSIGCLGTGEIYITKEILPDPFLKKEYQICEGTSVFLTPDPGYESYQIFWKNNMQAFTIEAFETGEYISYMQSAHCKDTFVVNVEKIDTPDAKIVDLRGEDKYCFDLESTTLKVFSSHSNLDYDWNGLSRDDELEINDQGIYRVDVSNHFCTSSYSHSIKEYCKGKLYLPNSFTPNNDGLNDLFTPVINEYITNYNFRIYNRWGELIFKTNQISEGWDGRVNREIAEIDAYVYKISYQYLSEIGGTRNESLVGTVLLMR